MVESLLVVGGAALVALTFLDAFMTTLDVSAGAGPVSSRVLALAWRTALRFHRRDSESSFLTGVGTVLLAGTVLLWVSGLWLGWTAVFLGSETVVSSTSRAPAGVADVAYFSGFTVFTLGTGDFVLTDAGWRLVSSLASFSGLFLITLAITYLISVISAVVERRAIATHIHSLGDSASDIVTRGWDGTRFTSQFQQHLATLTTALITSAEQHLAYPVLHYFHTGSGERSAPVAIADLDDALCLLACGVAPDHRPDPNVVTALRYAIDRYVVTATGIAWVPDVEAPPPPCLAPLNKANIPRVDAESFERLLEGSTTRRQGLHRLVTSDGWSWPSPVGTAS